MEHRYIQREFAWLGLTSTLVLVNGKRQTIAGGIRRYGHDPHGSSDLVEILKEGATATYGSDAVAGVVNFILRDDFEGLEVSVGHQKVESSDQTTDDVSVLAGFAVGDECDFVG